MTKEQFLEWKESEVTKWVFKYLEQQKQDYLERLGNGIDDDKYTDKIVGRVQAYNDLLLIDWED